MHGDGPHTFRPTHLDPTEPPTTPASRLVPEASNTFGGKQRQRKTHHLLLVGRQSHEPKPVVLGAEERLRTAHQVRQLKGAGGTTVRTREERGRRGVTNAVFLEIRGATCLRVGVRSKRRTVCCWSCSLLARGENVLSMPTLYPSEAQVVVVSRTKKARITEGANGNSCGHSRYGRSVF